MPSDVLITPATSKIDFTDGANSTKKLSISGTAFSFNSNLNVLSSTSLSSAFKAEGVNGTLFEVTDDLSNSLMSVNTIGGLPVFEVFANNSIIGGQYGANDFVISGNKIGLGYANPVNKLSVSGSVSIGSSYNVAAPSNGLIVQGSVGIGITNPTAKLDVAGGGLSVSGWSNNNSGSTGGVEIGWDGSQGIFQVYDRVNNNYEPILINGSAIQFFISGGLKWTLSTAGVLQSNNAQTIQTSTGNLTLATAAGDGHVLLSPHNNGNVGIGTASPGQKLEVNGRGLFTGSTVASAGSLQVTAADAALRLKWTYSPVADKNTWDIRSVGTGATPCLQFRTVNDANTVFTDRVAFTNDGNVGIGTVTPAGKLHVYNGSSHFEATSTGAAVISSGLYALQIGPLHDRLTTAGSYYGGIAFNHLLNYEGGTTYNVAPQAWIGTRLQDFAGSERDCLVFATKSGTGTTGAGNDLPVERMCIDYNGNVGIGQTSPARLLEVKGTTTPPLRLNTTVGNCAIEFLTSSSTYSWLAGAQYTASNLFEITPSTAAAGTTFSTPALAIKSDGNVGIGTIVPLGKLHVNSTVAGATLVRADGTNGTLFSVVDDLSDSLMSVNNSAGLPVLEVFADDRVVAGQYGANDFVLINNKLGLGTSSPANKLTVIGAASIGSSTYNVAAPSNGLIVQGNVGIGVTTNPESKLQVNGEVRIASSSSYFTHLNYLDGGSNLISSSNGGSTLFRGSANNLTSMVVYGSGTVSTNYNTYLAATSGNVGIGTQSPSNKTTIEADATGVSFADNSVAQLVIRGATDTTKRLGLGVDTTNNIGVIQAQKYGTGAYPLALNPVGGNVGIGTTSPATLLQIGTETPTSATGGIQFGSDTTARIYRVGAGNIQISNSLTVGGTITGNVTGNVSGTAASETFATVTGRGSGTTTQISVGTTSAGSMFTGEKIGSGYSDNLSGATFKSITNHPTGASFAFAAYYGGLLGTNSFYVSAEGGAYFKSNVGIGTSTANNKLVVVAGGDVSGINLSYDGAGNNRTGLFAWTRGSSLASLGGGVEYTAASTFTARSTAASYVEFGSGETRFYGNASLTSGNGFTPTERVRISAIGNVGIGTTAPYTNLDVQGLTDASLGAMGLQSQLSVSDSRNQIEGVGGGISFTGKYITSNATQTVFGLIRGAKANSTTANVVGHLELYAFGGSFKFHSQYNQVIGSNAVLMTLTDVGNLGIGTTSPTSKLDVTGGNIELDPNQYISFNNAGTVPKIGYRTSGPQAGLDLYDNAGLLTISLGNQSVGIGDYAGGNALPVKGLAVSGNVGIGKTTPNAKLNILSTSSLSSVFKTEGVNGTLFEVTDDLSNSLMSVNTIGGLPVFEVFANNSIIAGQYGQNDFVISGNKVGIGTASPIYKLDVRGSTVNARVGLMEFGSWPTNTTYIYLQHNTLSSIEGNYGFLQGSTGETFLNAASGQTLHFRIGNSEKWAVLSTGVLQSDGLQTIQTSTGTLTLATALGNGNIILSPHGTGNVGIGTPIPTARLDVRPNTPIAAYQGTVPYQTTTAAILSPVMAAASVDTYTSILQLVSVRQALVAGRYAHGYLGFSTVDNSNVNGILDAGRISIKNDDGVGLHSATSMGFWTNPGGSASTAAIERVRIASDGNVGIGTTSPITLLQIGTGTPTAATGGIQFGGDTSARLYRSAISTITCPGNVTALGGVNLNAAGTARIRWRSAGQGTSSALNHPFYLNVATGSINIEVEEGDTGGLMIDNEGVTVYGAGDGTSVFRVIDEDVYQSNSNITLSRTFWINEGLNGGGGILGAFTISGNTAIHAGNYTSYPDATKLPLAGGTLTGTLNGTTGSFSGNLKGGRVTLRDDCLEQHVDDSDGVGIFVNYFGYNSGTTRFRNFGVFNGKNQQLLYITGSTGATAITGTLAVSSAITQDSNQVLHAGNYISSYIAKETSYTTPIDASGYSWVRIPYAAGYSFNDGQSPIEFYVTRSIFANGSTPYGGCTAKFVIQSQEWHNGQQMATVQYGERGDSASLGAANWITHAKVTNLAGGGYWVYLRLRTGTAAGITYYIRRSAVGGQGLNPAQFENTTDPGGAAALYYGFNLISAGTEARFYRDGNMVLDAGTYGGYSTFTGTVTAINFSGPGTSLTGTASSLVAGSANAIADGVVSTSAKIANSVVTLAKIANISTSTILGNNGVSAGAPIALIPSQVASMLSGQTMNIVGTSTNVTGTVLVANGGTGATAAAAARTNLGATTLGANLFTLPNTSTSKKYIEINADNTVTLLEAAAFRNAIGAGVGNGNGTVTNVTSSGGLTGSGSVTPDISIATNGVTTAKIANSNVTLAKLANIDTGTILGNNTGGAAAPLALTSAQVVTMLGIGTSSSGTVTNIATGDGLSGGPITATGTITVDTTVVRTTGTQTIGGAKTFSSTIGGSINGNAGSVTDGVYLSTNQSIGGVKTFSAAPIATNIAKAWVYYNMNNNTTYASYNVSSVADNGTGVCTVNFSTAMVDANYVVAGTATYGYDDADIYAMILAVPRRSTAQQAGSCRLATEYIHGAQVYDSVAVRAVFYR